MPVAHPQSQRPTPRDIVISLDILSVIMKDEFSVSVHTSSKQTTLDVKLPQHANRARQLEVEAGESHEYTPSPSTNQQPRASPSSIFISDVSSVRDSLSLSGGTDEALHPSDPPRPTPEVNGLAAGAKSNPPTPMLFSIGSAQACSTSSVSTAKTKRHRYFTRSSRRNNEG